MRAVQGNHVEIADWEVSAHTHRASHRHVCAAAVYDFGASCDNVLFREYAVGKPNAQSACTVAQKDKKRFVGSVRAGQSVERRFPFYNCMAFVLQIEQTAAIWKLYGNGWRTIVSVAVNRVFEHHQILTEILVRKALVDRRKAGGIHLPVMRHIGGAQLSAVVKRKQVVVIKYTEQIACMRGGKVENPFFLLKGDGHEKSPP